MLARLLHHLPKKLLQSMIELLLFFPIVLIIGLYLIDSDHPWLWIANLPVFYLFGILGQTLFSLRWRWLQFLMALLVSGLITYLVTEGIIALAVSWVIGFILVFRGIRMMEVPWRVTFPVQTSWIGLAIYFFAHFFFRYKEEVTSYLPVITWLGICSLIICLFMTNLAQLKQESLSGNKEPVISSTMVRHNRVLMLGIVAIILFVGAFRQIKDAVAAFFMAIIRYLFSLFESSEEPLPPAEQPDMPQGQMPSLGPDAEPSLLAVILEKIFYYLIIVVLIVAALVLAYYAIKKLGKLIYQGVQWILTMLNQKSNVDLTDRGGYVDEKENLLNWRDLPQSYADRLKDWLAKMLEKEPRWEDLTTNRQRARFLYRHHLLQLIGAGYSLKSHYTAKETGKDVVNWREPRGGSDAQQVARFATLYDQARFADEELGDAQLEEMKRLSEALQAAKRMRR